MSTDAIADALVNACESNIKFLSQFLTSLHSIDALHRLKEKTEFFEAFFVITSFVQVVVPTGTAAPTPLTTVDPGRSSAEARLERLERREEGGELAGVGGRQEDTIPGFAHTHVLTHPSASEDDRDDGVRPPPPPTPVIHLPPLDDYSDLLHGPGPSPTKLDERELQQAKTKPLYSILVYFPILTQYRTRVTEKQKKMLESIVVERPDVGGASIKSPLLSTEIYPRIRLVSQLALSIYNAIDCQSIALVLDDNPERLRATHMRLLAAQRTFWGDLHDSPLIKDEASIFIRTWGERPSILAFTCNVPAASSQHSKKVDDVRRDPVVLVRALFERYPVLARFQPFLDCRLEAGYQSSLSRLPGGGRRVHYVPGNGSSGKGDSLYVFIPLFPGVDLREALGGSNGNEVLEDFCEDFVLQHGSFVFQDCLRFQISFQTLGDPSLPLPRLWW